jgi:transposase
VEDDQTMADPERGTDRAGRRAKRFLTPLQKYEVFLQLVRQEVTMAEAADHWQVDCSTIMRIRTVAKEGALEALAKVPAGQPRQRARPRAGGGPGRCAAPGRGPQGDAVKLMLVEGKGRWG